MSQGYPAPPLAGTEVLTTVSGVVGWSSSAVTLTDHTTLSNLGWTASGHTGTASAVAGFSGAGAAAYLAIGVDLMAYDATMLVDADIGGSVQAFDAGLTSIAGLTTLADRMIYTTAHDVYAVATLTSYARTILDDTTAAAAATTLGLGTGDAVAHASFQSGTWSGPGTPLNSFSPGLAVEGSKALFYNAGANGGFTSYYYTAAYAALGYTFGLQVSAAQGVLTGTRATAGNSIVELVAVTTGASTAMVRFGRGSTTTGAKQYQFIDQGTTLQHLLTDLANDSYFCGGGGVLGVGTASPSSVYSLDVHLTAATGHVANFENDSTGAGADGVRVKIDVAAANTGNLFMEFVDGGGTVGSIAGDGTGVSYNVTSDRRLKKDIVAASGCLDVVNTWPVSHFTWRKGNRRQTGFIAQALHKVRPRSVYDPTGRNAARLCVTYDHVFEDDVSAVAGPGEDIPEPIWEEVITPRTDCMTAAALAKLRQSPSVRNIVSRPLAVGDEGWGNWGVDHSSLVPEIVGAVQELSALVDTLLARIEALERR